MIRHPGHGFAALLLSMLLTPAQAAGPHGDGAAITMLTRCAEVPGVGQIEACQTCLQAASPDRVWMPGQGCINPRGLPAGSMLTEAADCAQIPLSRNIDRCRACVTGTDRDEVWIVGTGCVPRPGARLISASRCDALPSAERSA
jgi:hypothetical protein